MVARSLVLLLIVSSAACALKPSTVPIVSVGNTGCPEQKLAVFDYDQEHRSWTAVCEDQVFRCSDVGRRTTRCSPSQDTNPELLRRARWLRRLPAERALLFVTADVMSLRPEDFEQRVALAQALPSELLRTVVRGRVLVLPASTLTKLRPCEAPDIREVVVTKTGTLDPWWDWDEACIEHALQGFRAPAGFGAGEAALTTTVSSEAIAKWIEDNRALDVRAGHASQAPDATASAAHDDARAAPLSPTSAEASALRASLDAKAPDILACMGRDRAVVEVRLDAEGHGSLIVRDLDPQDPIQDCVRVAFGDVPAAPGPTTVVHLLRGAQ